MFCKALAGSVGVCVVTLAASAALAGSYLAGSLGVQLAVSPPLTPVAVFGEDNRVELPDKYGVLEGKIGMLYEQSTQTLCTAFCVGAGAATGDGA